MRYEFWQLFDVWFFDGVLILEEWVNFLLFFFFGFELLHENLFGGHLVVVFIVLFLAQVHYQVLEVSFISFFLGQVVGESWRVVVRELHHGFSVLQRDGSEHVLVTSIVAQASFLGGAGVVDVQETLLTVTDSYGPLGLDLDRKLVLLLLADLIHVWR